MSEYHGASNLLVMLVGFYDDITTLHVEKALRKRGADVAIFDTGEIGLSAKIAYIIKNLKFSGSIEIKGRKIDIDNIHSVWMRRTRERRMIEPDIPNDNAEFIRYESEGAIIGLLRILEENHQIRFLSSPINMWVAENKPYQLWVASKCGFKIPDTLYTNDVHRSDNFIEKYDDGKLITKLIDTQSNIVVDQNNKRWGIATNILDKDHYYKNRKAIETVPYCFQECIYPKIDVRVTIVDNNIFATSIHSDDIDWRTNDYRKLKHEIIELPESIKHACHKLMNHLGLKFGGIDLVIEPDNEFYFLEINPSGQWLWIEEMVGHPITESIVNFLLTTEYL